MKDRIIAALQEAAAEFISRESNHRSMITVTRVALNPRGDKAEIYVSVYPEKNIHAATDFLNRQRGAFRDFLGTRVQIRALPRVTFLAEPNIAGTIEEEPAA